jgi:hypothetical protein
MRHSGVFPTVTMTAVRIVFLSEPEKKPVTVFTHDSFVNTTSQSLVSARRFSSCDRGKFLGIGLSGRE